MKNSKDVNNNNVLSLSSSQVTSTDFPECLSLSLFPYYPSLSSGFPEWADIDKFSCNELI